LIAAEDNSFNGSMRRSTAIISLAAPALSDAMAGKLSSFCLCGLIVVALLFNIMTKGLLLDSGLHNDLILLLVFTSRRIDS
jgi:hypothetical protein